MALLALLLLPALAEASRLHGSSSLRSSRHALGLETEHELSQRWPVQPSEAAALKRIIAESLHGGEADIAWNWSVEEKDWFFPSARITESDGKRGLAYHMLHRHGLAPLAAVKHKTAFESFLRGRGLPKEGLERADGLAMALEDFGPVQELLEGLSGGNFSMDALRNLHSWDHQWAKNGVTYYDDRYWPLQAAFSKKAHELMVSGGFTEEVCKAAMRRFNRLWDEKPHWSDLSFMGMKEENTGEKTLSNLRFEGGNLRGRLYWEGSKGYHDLNIRVPLGTRPRLLANVAAGKKHRTKKEALEALAEEHIAGEIKKHRAWFAERRVHFWAGEDAEFVEMYGNRGFRKKPLGA